MSACRTGLSESFVGHDVKTVREAGFAGLKNGALLRAADASFDVLITVDRNIPYQQNLIGLNIAILILITKSNRYDDLKPRVPQALQALKSVRPGSVVVV